MEYRVGGRPESFGSGIEGHKFVIVKEGEDLVYYAKLRGNLEHLNYDDFVNENSCNVIATGLVDHGGGGERVLGIWSGHLDLKPASKSLMKNFEGILLESYRQICPDLETIVNLCVERKTDKD